MLPFLWPWVSTSLLWMAATVFFPSWTEISNRLRVPLAALGMHFWLDERPVKIENSAAGVCLTMKSGKILETEAALLPRAAAQKSSLCFQNLDRKSTRLNSSHEWISYAVFCLKKKKKKIE